MDTIHFFFVKLTNSRVHLFLRITNINLNKQFLIYNHVINKSNYDAMKKNDIEPSRAKSCKKGKYWLAKGKRVYDCQIEAPETRDFSRNCKVRLNQ